MTKLQKIIPEKGLNVVVFESPTHNSTLLQGLNNLRKKSLLLDITLVADNVKFEAHRVVLAACSEYFRAMFTDEMKESQQNEIYLNGVTAEGMKHLIEYVYTSKLSLNLANIQDILSVASHVQIFPVVEACSAYLQTQLDLENCVDIVTIAETYSLTHLRKRVYQFICDNFLQFSHSNELNQMSPTQIEYLLKCDFPVNCSEAEILSAVIRWTEFDLYTRSPYVNNFLKNIRFHQIPLTFLQTFMISKLFRTVLSKCPSLYCKVIAESYKHISDNSGLVNSRGMELALVKIGGFGVNGVTNQITYYHSSCGHWKYLTSIPHVEQCNYGTAVFNNELYVVGGCFNQSLQENIHPFGFCYNPQFNKWTTIAPLQKERCRFTLSVVYGYLYAIGGVSESTLEDNFVGEGDFSCEKYDPAIDTWTFTTPLLTFRTQHAACTWQNFIFISGGLDKDFVLDTVLSFNAVTSLWDRKCSLPIARADHSMLTYGNKLYVCGGWHEDEITGNRILADSIVAYDTLLDVWEHVTFVPTPRYHAGIVIIGCKLYIIGGFHSDVIYDRASGIVESYNLEENTWMVEERYPQEIWEHTCATLYIPKGKDDMEVIADPIRR